MATRFAENHSPQFPAISGNLRNFRSWTEPGTLWYESFVDNSASLKTTQNLTPNRRAISIAEFASDVGISLSLAQRIVARGEIRSMRVGRRIIIPIAEIDRWLQRASSSTPA